MSNALIETIISQDDSVRNRSIYNLLKGMGRDDLMQSAYELEDFRRSSDNLYHKVRASLFLFVIYRFHLGMTSEIPQQGEIPFDGVKAAFDRDFESSISIYLSEIRDNGKHDSSIYSAIADSYYKISFKYLLDQVMLSISQCAENHHLYNIKSLDDYPFRAPSELTAPDNESGLYPVGVDASPVRLDPSHSGWSDIFFLGMDFPEGARVVNMSVDLRVRGSESDILPPCECYCRYVEEPAILLSSIDLKASKKVSDLKELFNFGNDHLSLLKAGVVASGIVPPCLEESNIPLKDILRKLLGKEGGIEIVTKVNGIPKGSRLAVSTTLLATIITRLMRFSGQIKEMNGPVNEQERRTAASRAILGEWLGGSGGGWQDSGGLWPGIKVIAGIKAGKDAPEFGVSRGCLLPKHNVFSMQEIPEETEKQILDSIVLVHGGISQDVGPILEMVTIKYLLKLEKEWAARLKGIRLFDSIVDALKAGDMKELGRLTTEDWEASIQKVIPWVNNSFTADLIEKAKQEFGEDYWGFLMLGGMSGGGMAFIIDPKIKDTFMTRISVIMLELRNIYRSSFPFIIDPVTYDFQLNHEGITSRLFTGRDALMPRPVPLHNAAQAPSDESDEADIKNTYGFDARSHAHIRSLLKGGRIGLAENSMPESTRIENVGFEEIQHFENENATAAELEAGITSLRNNEVAVVTFAGGMGSRWSGGAAVAKPVNPFINIEGRYRTFIEIHLAKSRKSGEISGSRIPHVFTTSYLTHDTITEYLRNFDNFCYSEALYLSPAKSIGRRVYPMARDLRYLWEVQMRQKLDDNVQKLQENIHNALIHWAKSRGEGEDYDENRSILRFNPPGHWYEIPNLLKNGVLAEMLRRHRGLKYLLCHNIDTLGSHIDPALLGMHINSGRCMTFEVTPRRIEDAGGGLAKVDGHIQLVEGLALPREEDEYKLSYYNTLTNWITIDPMLEFFGISREMILNAQDDAGTMKKILDSIHEVEKQIPTYVTIKNVKHLWGSGQEDVYPIAQFEKLWGDMTSLPDLDAGFVSVSRYRGTQLKEPALLDMWANDGSLEYLKKKCIF
jgi:galactokinase/mevalonate kinase-like predicted kinase